MAVRYLLIRLPEELVQWLMRRLHLRGLTASVQRGPEQASRPDNAANDRLAQAAIAVERDERLALQMAEWDATAGDG